jgi:hypothetical protein
LTACSQKTTGSSVPTTISSASSSQPSVQDDAKMEALITEKLGGHHTLDFILNQNKTRAEWESTINRMINKGVSMTDEEKTLIIDWLVSRNK